MSPLVLVGLSTTRFLFGSGRGGGFAGFGGFAFVVFFFAARGFAGRLFRRSRFDCGFGRLSVGWLGFGDGFSRCGLDGAGRGGNLDDRCRLDDDRCRFDDNRRSFHDGRRYDDRHRLGYKFDAGSDLGPQAQQPPWKFGLFRRNQEHVGLCSLADATNFAGQAMLAADDLQRCGHGHRALGVYQKASVLQTKKGFLGDGQGLVSDLYAHGFIGYQNLFCSGNEQLHKKALSRARGSRRHCVLSDENFVFKPRFRTRAAHLWDKTGRMCGIIGYIGKKPVTPLLVDALKRLEYRGYDSAGIAVLQDHKTGDVEQDLCVVRCRGKISELEKQLANAEPSGHVGIGHTRWATHGKPSSENAHPHRFGSVAVVHNGIIENYLALKESLVARGHTFSSETDTEIVAHLLDEEIRKLPFGPDRLLEATRRALLQVKGAYAVVALSLETPDEVVCAKSASPLVLGIGEGENLVASDVPPLLSHTRNVIFLEEGDLAQLRRDRMRIVGMDGKPRDRNLRLITWSVLAAEKAGYRHFMQKEIHEQPGAITDTLRGRIAHSPPDALLDGIELFPAHIKRLFLVACGTSFHASLIGKYLIETLARIPVEVDLASEFRYRNPIVSAGDLVLSVSQSGETADTLAAVREAKQKGAQVLSIANVLDSSIPRASDHAFYTHAGPEIGVASTKAFTTQLVALALVAVHLGRRNGQLSEQDAAAFLNGLASLPAKITQTLECAERVRDLARKLCTAGHVLYLGRGVEFPIALEGALKLKEISYIHAEGYAAGELKHGPIALIDETMFVVALAPRDASYEKMLSNLSEVKARGGKIFAVVTRGEKNVQTLAEAVIEVPDIHPLLWPLLTVVPLQLLAYYVADFKGTDVDQPRNLAKSVTVE